MTVLSNNEESLLNALLKPKYNFSDTEKHFLEKGLNPYAPHMKEDYERCKKILENTND